MSEELFTVSERIEYLGLGVLGGRCRWSFRDKDSDVIAIIDLLYSEDSPTGEDCLLAFVGSPSDGKLARLDQVQAMFSTLSENEKAAFCMMASKHPSVLKEPVFAKAFGDESVKMAEAYANDPWHFPGGKSDAL